MGWHELLFPEGRACAPLIRARSLSRKWRVPNDAVIVLIEHNLQGIQNDGKRL